MITQYFSEKGIETPEYDFSFICITQDKEKDNELINELQKNILKSYRAPNFYQLKKNSLTRTELENYIKNNVIPKAENGFDYAVRYGDFGEVFASMILRFLYHKESFNKLRWKYNPDKSVMGTDLVSFDSIDNPTEIIYSEVKTLQNALEKKTITWKKVNGRKVPDITGFITVVAYNSLEKDIDSSRETILDYMSRLYLEKEDYKKAQLFSDLVEQKKTIDKSFKIFIITDSSIIKDKETDNEKDFLQTLTDIATIKNKISPLSVTYIFIDKIKELVTDTWDTIVSNGGNFIEENTLL